tara:strand:+ start:838 stop:1317 length:480 start_codon:yes stop_codon:yes gene_type:complete
MKLNEVRFPIYVVHTDEVVIQDGILWCADAVVDDKNVSGDSIGQRRLKTPLKNLYDLKYQINTFGDMTKHRGKFYVDSNGKFFTFFISKKAILKYHAIDKIQSKDVMTLVWISGIPFPFEVARPPQNTDKYAGVLYINNKPSFIYEITDTKKKDTWRKI